MPVFALWSAPRARSTAFFRSMLERGDLLALHEPFCNLIHAGETDVDGRTFDAPVPLLAWLRDETHDVSVFLKDTTDSRYREVLLADRRFLAEARHAFLIRRPEEIAASLYALIQTIKSGDALYPDMRIEDIGLEALHELHAAVHDAGGNRPVVIDSDGLVARPEATMAAYCAAVELPFIPQALTWEPGERPEWRRSARWHADVSASSRFEQRERRYTHTVETSDELARFAAHHVPFYEQLHAHRLDVAAWGARGGLLTDQPARAATSGVAARTAASVLHPPGTLLRSRRAASPSAERGRRAGGMGQGGSLRPAGAGDTVRHPPQEGCRRGSGGRALRAGPGGHARRPP